MEHTCPKCGTKRKSFELMYAHLSSCNASPKGIGTTEILSPKGTEAESGLLRRG